MLASISTFFAWALEYYDFLIYFSLIPYISELFFPKSNPLAALLYTLLVFAVGYFARPPLGAIFFGHIGISTVEEMRCLVMRLRWPWRQ